MDKWYGMAWRERAHYGNTLHTAETMGAAALTPRALLRDNDPLIRIAALGMLEPADPVNRLSSMAPSLTDPIRGVRVESARILADITAYDSPT